MNPRVLIALGPQDMAAFGDLLLEELEACVGVIPPDSYRMISNQSHALTILDAKPIEYDLLLTHVDLPQAPRHPLSLGAALGLELVTELRRKQIEIPCIILAPTAGGNLIRSVRYLCDCYIVQIGVGWRERFMEALGHFFDCSDDVRVSRQEPVAEVEIRFSPASYRIHTRNAGLAIDLSGSLELDTLVIRQLMSRSAEVSTFDYPHWKRNLEEIGRMFAEALAQSGEFTDNFETAFDSVGRRLGNVRFRFAVDANVYRIALEALNLGIMSAAVDRDVFSMLRTPMARLLKYPTMLGAASRPKGFSGAPINVLIIEAGASGFVDGAGYLPPLANVEPECRDLALLVHERRRIEPRRFAEPRWLCIKDRPGHEVKVVVPPGGVTFAEHVRRHLLSGTTWHLVHFSGHCHFDDDAGDGCVFLPERDSISGVRLSEFADWLRYTCLLYLTSCRYSEDDVILRLLQSPVSASAVVGFRWDLDDGHAIHYAAEFYKELLDSGLVENAYVNARNALHSRHETNRIWASPVLVLRDNECVDTVVGSDVDASDLMGVTKS